MIQLVLHWKWATLHFPVSHSCNTSGDFIWTQCNADSVIGHEQARNIMQQGGNLTWSCELLWESGEKKYIFVCVWESLQKLNCQHALQPWCTSWLSNSLLRSSQWYDRPAAGPTTGCLLVAPTTYQANRNNLFSQKKLCLQRQILRTLVCIALYCMQQHQDQGTTTGLLKPTYTQPIRLTIWHSPSHH